MSYFSTTPTPVGGASFTLPAFSSLQNLPTDSAPLYSTSSTARSINWMSNGSTPDLTPLESPLVQKRKLSAFHSTQATSDSIQAELVSSFGQLTRTIETMQQDRLTQIHLISNKNEQLEKDFKKQGELLEEQHLLLKKIQQAVAKAEEANQRRFEKLEERIAAIERNNTIGALSSSNNLDELDDDSNEKKEPSLPPFKVESHDQFLNLDESFLHQEEACQEGLQQ